LFLFARHNAARESERERERESVRATDQYTEWREGGREIFGKKERERGDVGCGWQAGNQFIVPRHRFEPQKHGILSSSSGNL